MIETTISKWGCECGWEGNNPTLQYYEEGEYLEHCPQCGNVANLNWNNPNVQLKFLKKLEEVIVYTAMGEKWTS